VIFNNKFIKILNFLKNKKKKKKLNDRYITIWIIQEKHNRYSIKIILLLKNYIIKYQYFNILKYKSNIKQVSEIFILF